MIRVLPILVVIALAACSRTTPAAASTESAAPASAAPQAAPAPEVPAKPVAAVLPEVVARVNGETIAKADLERAIAELQGHAGPVPDEQRDRIYRDVLDQLIGYRLLIQETKSRQIAIADAEIDGRIAEIQKQFPSEEAFKQVLDQRGMTVAGLRADAREGMQSDKMLAAETAGKISVTPAQLTDFYEKNPAQFQQPERVRASHILIGLPEGADTAAKEQARVRAAEVLKEVKAGKDFAGLAKQHSQDPGSAVNGGDLGFFNRGQMVGPFDQVAFTLPPGQTSDLVETNFGFHVIRVTEKQPSRTLPLDEIRPKLQEFLEGQNREELTQAFVDSLKAKGKVEILI